MTWTILETGKCCSKVPYLISQKCKHHKFLCRLLWLRLSEAHCVDHPFFLSPTFPQHSLSSNLSLDPFPQPAGHQLTALEVSRDGAYADSAKMWVKDRLRRKSISPLLLWEMSFSLLYKVLEKSQYHIVSFSSDFRKVSLFFHQLLKTEL